MYAMVAASPGRIFRSPLVTDFSEYAIGAMSGQGWALSSATNFSATIAVAGATGTKLSSKAAVIDKTTSDASRFATMDAVPVGTTNFEMLAHILIATVPASNGETVGCLIGRYTNTTHYYICLPRKITAGATKIVEIGKEAGSGATPLDHANIAFDATEFWWIRFRVQGTSLKCKMWRHDAGEPGSWDVSTTDSSNSSGRCGFATFYEAYNFRCDFLSIALGSGSAAGPGG